MRYPGGVMRGLGPAFLLVALLCAAPAQAREHDLVDPPPVAVPTTLTPGEVSTTLHQVFEHQRWAVVTDDGEHAVMKYDVKEHSASVSVDYSGPAITIRYLDSSAMSYSEDQGHRSIHPKYNVWVKDVADELAYALGSDVPADMATLRPAYDSPVTIHSIDHQLYVLNPFKFRNSHPKPPERLTAGKHVVSVSCGVYPLQTGIVDLWLVATPGGRYRLVCVMLSSTKAEMHLIDAATAIPVGGIVGSDDEPKGGGNTRADESKSSANVGSDDELKSGN